jgi:predicted PurR-regulated permease PerM
MFLGSTINSIKEDLPEYDKALKSKSEVILKELKKRNIKINKNEFDQIFNTKNIIKQFSSALKGISSFISNMLIVILLVSFMLIESIHISKKIRAISRDSHLLLSEFRDIIHTYISLKSIISLVTAILVAILLSLLGVNYPLFWAVVAFFLNFIPNIGSLIAAVPSVLLAFIQHDFTIAIIVAIGYLLINFIMGNMVEPKIMGKGMGLSTLIVFISLLVWGWILGPVGMLLSVPLTMLIKLFFEKNSNTKWIAFILDSKIPGLKS